MPASEGKEENGSEVDYDKLLKSRHQIAPSLLALARAYHDYKITLYWTEHEGGAVGRSCCTFQFTDPRRHKQSSGSPRSGQVDR